MHLFSNSVTLYRKDRYYRERKRETSKKMYISRQQKNVSILVYIRQNISHAHPIRTSSHLFYARPAYTRIDLMYKINKAASQWRIGLLKSIPKCIWADAHLFYGFIAILNHLYLTCDSNIYIYS